MEANSFQLPDDAFVFGFPEEWLAFRNKHGKFLEAFPALDQTIRKVIIRSFASDSPANDLVFFLGSLVLEDFMEIWLLAGNGYGVGALKILRGMYERTVTAAYVSGFPADAERFWKYGDIAQRRLLNNARELYGTEQLKAAMAPGRMEQIERDYQETRHEFEETVCARCELFRTMFSWSKYDLASMAKKAGFGLEHCYFNAYAIPTQQAHSTVLSVITRLKRDESGHYFDSAAQHIQAASAMSTAHVVMLKMLHVQNSFFSLGLEQEIRERDIECKAIWPGLDMDCGKDL